MAGRLAGKVAIITGSTSGIGRGTAVQFAQEGAKVVVSGRRAELGESLVEEIKGAGGEATYIQTDVTKSDEVHALIEGTVAKYGRLDILMNNAYSGKYQSVTEMDEADWDYTMSVQLKATFLASKLAILEMQRTGGGAIIITSSVHGVLAARRSAAYETAKAGLINLTRQMAVDYGRDNIRVNAICPGLIVVERSEERFRNNPELERKAAAVYPIRRVGRVSDIANAAVFLASDESSFITGHSLLVDGGMTIQLQDSFAYEYERFIRGEIERSGEK